MKLWYVTAASVPEAHNSDVLYSVYDADILRFKHFTNIELGEFYIDEIGENVDLCYDIYRTIGIRDITGRTKYSVSGGFLFVNDNWSVV